MGKKNFNSRVMRAIKVNFKIIAFLAVLGSAAVMIFAAELTRVVDEYYTEDTVAENEKKPSEEIAPYPTYDYGDWEKHIHRSSESLYSTSSKADDESILIEFKMPINFSYGKSFYTNSKYQTNVEDEPSSADVTEGYYSSMNYMLKVNGYVNDSLYLNIDHDSERENTDENIYEIIYNSTDPESFLQQFKIGNIQVDFNKSQFTFYDNSSQRATGFSTVFKKNNLTFEMFGIVNENLSAVDYFTGFKKNDNIKLREYQYVRRKFYQIEPFKRYDNKTTPPNVSSIAARRGLIAFTSAPQTAVPPVSMDQYSLSAVNVTAGSLEIFRDDQIGSNNSNSIQFPGDDGFFDKLSQGADYSVNLQTGEIEFSEPLGRSDRAVALYNISGSATSDPSAQNLNGKIFIYLKYGESLSSIEVDAPTKGYDVYEIRSRYYLGNTDITSGSFDVAFSDERGTLQSPQIRLLGGYNVNYSEGYMLFNLREPFRTNLSDTKENFLYSQTEISNMYVYSEFSIESSYNINSGNVMLSHNNIIPESVSVKIDKNLVSSSLYTVDYLTGEINFDKSYAASVSQNAEVEIKYQYKNEEESESSFIAGARADYALNKNINLGTSLLYSQDSNVYEIPDIDSAPKSNLVGEVDAELNYSAEYLTKLLKPLLGMREVPFSYRGYCEYARSVMVVNTFGYGLIDDFDSPGSALNIKLNDDNWILASPPNSLLQSERTQLKYKYYRDPADDYKLKGDGFDYFDIAYGVKPGPYNIAERYLEKNDISLVLDFDFNGADSYACAAVQSLDEQAADFSALQYVEIVYRSAGGNGMVDMSFDLGRINEDSDADGILDTEDRNHNGYLDSDPSLMIFEDSGYVFNPLSELETRIGSGPRINYQTKGDGVLTSEDLNGNSQMDNAEDVITFPSVKALINGAAGQTTLTIDMTDTSWKKVRIYLDRKSLSSADFELLRKCEALRFYITADNNAVDEGRIFINSIDLVMLDWNEIRINGLLNDDAEKLKVSFVDTVGDGEYSSNSFSKKEKDEYEKLFSNAAEENSSEGALEISYLNLDGVPPNGSVTRKFAKSLDFSMYDKLNLWLNVRSFTPGDNIEIIFGRSSWEFFVYNYTFNSADNWQKIQLKLNENASDGISYTGRNGNADLTEINYITVKINGNSGRFWINNIYVSDPQDVTGQAFYAENSLQSERALILHENRKYLDNTGLKHVFKYVEGSFMSPERNDFGTEIVFNSIDFKTDVIRKMGTSVNYSRENKISDEFLFYQNENFSYNYLFNHDNLIFPDLSFKYGQNILENKSEESVSTSLYIKESFFNFYSFYTELFKDAIPIGNTNLAYHAFVGADYTRENMRRNLNEGAAADIEDDTTYMEQKNKYGTGFEVVNDSFNISADSELSNSLVNGYYGFDVTQSDPLQKEIKGNFYFPLYFNNNDYKLITRNNNFEINCEYTRPAHVSFGFDNSFVSSEDNFNDYPEIGNFPDKFSRERSLSLELDTLMKIPFSFYDNLLNFEFSYNKNSVLKENHSPFEREGKNYFNEKYGTIDQMNDLQRYQYDYAEYYPFYFFSGSSFMLNGRQVGEKIRNEQIKENGYVFPEYSNFLSVKDEFMFAGTFTADKYDVSCSFAMNNFCQRQNILTVPGQNFMLENNVSVTFDLIELLNITNSEIIEFSITAAYSFKDYSLITQNVVEYNHDPEISFVFDRKMYGFSLTSSIAYRIREDKEFIEYGITDEKNPDYIYSKNLSENRFTEDDKTYSVKLEFYQNLNFLKYLKLQDRDSDEYPVLTVDGELIINDYDYENMISPEPYDKYSLKADVSYKVYKYTKINFYGLTLLEKYYNRDTGGLYKEVVSYEAGAGIQIIF